MQKSVPCVFVGGPIQNAIEPNGIFNMEVRHLIESVIKVLKKSGIRVISSHIYENFGEMDVRGKFREVCSRDYHWMKECDFFLAILPLNSDGEVIFSSGTSVELGWASAMGKPIVLVRDSAPKYSHLVAGLAIVAQVTEVFINEKDFEATLCHSIAQVLKQKCNNIRQSEVR